MGAMDEAFSEDSKWETSKFRMGVKLLGLSTGSSSLGVRQPKPRVNEHRAKLEDLQGF